MAELKLVAITMLRGEFIHPAWREEGTVLEVDQRIADRWVTHGSARYGDIAHESPLPQLDHALGDFPGAELFAAAGFTTPDAVKQLIADKGDKWPKSVKGMTKQIAAAVSSAMESIADPATPDTTENAETT